MLHLQALTRGLLSRRPRVGRSWKSRRRVFALILLYLAVVALGCVCHGLYCQLLLERRSCAPAWETISEAGGQVGTICIVTLADDSGNGKPGARAFHGLLNETWPSRVKYGELHGYTVIDGSALLNDERPASWSKILAVQEYLPECSWLLWMDADAIIVNYGVKLEDILPHGFPSLDFVLTKDGSGYNAGIWAIRNSDWSSAFLRQWWGLSHFVRPRHPRETKSGDNDALKYLLAQMDRDELALHVGVVPQCAFNSYLWKGSVRNYIRFLFEPAVMVQGMYRSGDFILHLAGFDDKRRALLQFLVDEQLLD